MTIYNKDKAYINNYLNVKHSVTKITRCKNGLKYQDILLKLGLNRCKKI